MLTGEYENAHQVSASLTVDPPRGAGRTRERVAWLLENEKFWEGLYPAFYPRGEDVASLLRLAVRAKAAGLYSPRTGTRDVAHALVRLLSLARACQRFGVRP